MLITSCERGTEYANEIILLDSLKTDLSELQASLQDFDAESLMMIDSVVRAKADILNEGINDTLGKEEWMLLGNYTKAINKRLDKFDRRLDKLENEIDTSFRKIDDLKVDLENNVWERSKAMEYVTAEREKVVELSSTSRILKEKAARALEVYHEQHEKVDSLMDRIEERMHTKMGS